MRKIIFTLVCFFIALTVTAQQVRFVKEGGAGNGSTWANASGSLQAMINASAFGDEVWVAEGTYQPSVGQFFSLKEGVKVYGGFPSDNNAADMDDRNWNQNQTTLLSNGRSVIRNVFTSSNRMTSATLLDGFVITGNSVQVADEGAGIYNSYASPTLKNLRFINNFSTPRGGAMYNNHSTSLMVNVLFSGNRSNQGAVMDNRSSNLEFVNVTITKNLTGNSMIRNVNSNIIFKNSVVYGNKLPSITNTSSIPQFFYSLVQGFTTNDANGNLDGGLNPFLNNDNTLALNSPLVDSGLNALYVGGVDDFDLNKNDRFMGNIDIGAFENQDQYTGPKTIYVKSNAIGDNDGTSWENAFTNLQDAINNSLSGDKIFVAQGTYQPAAGQFFSMKEGVEIYGGFPNDNNSAGMPERNWAQYQTILLANGRSVIRNNFNSGNRLTQLSILDGFTITGNNVQVADEGAGIYNIFASPTLRNLRIINNWSGPRGGGMYNNNSSPKLINVLFANNRSNQGSAIENVNSSVVTLENVTIARNTLGNSIIRNTNSQTIFINTLVYGNKLPSITNSSSTVQFHSSLVQGFTTNDGNGNIDGNTNPLFVNAASGNFNLAVTSPAIDSGNNALYSGDINEDLDLNGNSRLSGASIDIGAFENQGCSEIALWNGSSWSQQPNINSNIIIQGDLTISSNIEGCSLTVVSGNVVVNQGITITLFNQIDVEGGSFTLRNQASLVQINNVNNTGEIIVQKTTKPMNLTNYGYWSSPVEGWRLNELSPLTQSPYYYSWNAAAQGWTQHLGGNKVMEAGHGYIVRAPSTQLPVVHNLTFEGTPNNGDVEMNVVGGNDFNFLGNPYPSAINIELFLADDDNDELDKVVHLWTNGYDYVDGTFVYNYEGFATYNAIGGTGETQSPTSQMPTAMIASGQGFFVNGISNGTVVFKNSHRVVGNNNNSFNRLAPKNRFWLNLESPESKLYAQTLVGYLEGATNGLDRSLDAKLFESEASLQIYSLLDSEKITIQGRALPFDDNDAFAIGYSVKNAGTYSIALPTYEGLFADGSNDIFVFDKQLNIVHNLKDSSYEFYSGQGTFDNRFEIVYKSISSDLISNNLEVYKQGGQFVIESSLEMSKVMVYDILGRLVYKADDLNTLNHILPQIQDEQILIIKAFFSNNESSVRKVKN